MKRFITILVMFFAMAIPTIAQTNSTQLDWTKVPAGWTHDDRFKGWTVTTTLDWSTLGPPPTTPCGTQNAYKPSDMSLRPHKVNVHESRSLEENTWLPMWTAGNKPLWVCQLRGTSFDFDNQGRRLYRTDCGNPAPEFPRSDIGQPYPAPAPAATPAQPAIQPAPTPAPAAAPAPAVCPVTNLSIQTSASTKQKLVGGIPDMLISVLISAGVSGAYSSGNRFNSVLTGSSATFGLNRVVNFFNPDHDQAKVSASLNGSAQSLKLKKGGTANLGDYTITWAKKPNQIVANSANPACPDIVIEPKDSMNITPIPWPNKTTGVVVKDSSLVRRVPQ